MPKIQTIQFQQEYRDIFRYKCNASGRVRTHDLVSARQTQYQLRYQVAKIVK